MYEYYKSLLTKEGIPKFLEKYLDCPSLLRLKNIGYFCGMDYASKDIYDFGEYVSRFDHSFDVALITWEYTKDKKATLAGLFHDIATPCFSHVVDYMNKDYANQESTEELTEEVIKSDKKLLELLKEDNIDVEEIIDFKRYTIVDNDRPKLCADRLDGVILTGLFWTKDLNEYEIKPILNDLKIFKNEDDEMELGFKKEEIAEKVKNISDNINVYCHSNEDNYMMELLAKLTRYSIEKGFINYEDLYLLDEEELYHIFDNIKNKDFKDLYSIFKNVKFDEVPYQEMPYVKKRELKPLVYGERIDFGEIDE